MKKKYPELTAQYLREILSYDPLTGVFKWIAPRKKIVVGAIAGVLEKGLYPRINITIDQRHYKAHRLAWLHWYGEWPKYGVDHIDGNPLNNNIHNLRDVPHAINQQNRTRANRNNRTGLLGVLQAASGRFVAYVFEPGNPNKVLLGTYDTAAEAHAVHIEAKRRLHPGCTI